MKIRVGDRLRCRETLNNVFGYPIFIKNNVYSVLSVYGDEITINHILYGSEFMDFPLSFIEKYFITLKEERRIKLENLKS